MRLAEHKQAKSAIYEVLIVITSVIFTVVMFMCTLQMTKAQDREKGSANTNTSITGNLQLTDHRIK
jgi:hypothetical protein